MKNILILIGTFWPVMGAGLAVLVAFLLSGWRRWLMLFIGPPLFLLPCIIYADEISYNGNMLFVALLGLVFVTGIIYYAALLITGIALVIKQKY